MDGGWDHGRVYLGGGDRLRSQRGKDTLHGEAGADEFYTDHYSQQIGGDTITDYILGAAKADSEEIYLSMGTETNLPTQTGADNDSDGDGNAAEYVITGTFDGGTAGTITFQGITSGSDNFANLDVAMPASSGETCSD